jgi:hypothetical protein
MKSFKSLALVFAAAIITLGASAQASTTAPKPVKANVKTANTKVTPKGTVKPNPAYVKKAPAAPASQK